MNNPISIEKQKEVQGTPTLQFSKDGRLIKLWNSIIDAERTLGFSHGNICRCCKGTYKTLGGYIWKYYDKETYLIGIMNNNIKKGAS